jgi:hypothetical protein
VLLLFQKSRDFFHGLVKEVRRGRGSEGDNGVLIMTMRRVAIDDNPAAGRARPILKLQTLRNEWSGINNKVRHFLLRRSFLGGRIARERRSF